MKERENVCPEKIPRVVIKAPKLNHIKATLSLKGDPSLTNIAKKIDVAKSTLLHFMRYATCSYATFVKLVAYCKEIAPDEDWYYTPREELIEVMKEFRKAGGRMGKASGISKTSLAHFSIGSCLPNMTAYYKLITYLGGKLNVPNNFSSN